MKNKTLIIILLFIISMFSFMIDVKAKDYAYCYYKHNTLEKNGDDFVFPIKKHDVWGRWKNEDSNLIIVIQYNSETITTPHIWAKMISSSSNVSLNTSQDFVKAINDSNIGYSLPLSGRNPAYEFRDLPTIKITQIQNNDGNLMCPNIYLYGDENTNPADGTISSCYYQISLLVNDKTVVNDEYDYKKTLTPLSISSVSSNKIEDSTTAFGCSYGVSFKSGFYSYNGTITFNVDNDGNVKQIGGTGDLETFDLTYTGDKLTQCPSYLKVNPNEFGGLKADITVGTADSYDGVYNGDVSTGEDNQDQEIKTIIKYYKYGDKNKYIKIEKVAGNYDIKLNDDTNLLITNKDDYMDIIKDNPTKLPTFIMKLKDSSEYLFVNSLKDEEGVNLQTDEIYIRAGALSVNGTGLSDELIISTCKQLFGDEDGGFLQFLDQYVFKVIWIGVPILLILLTTFDFAKVVFVDDKEGIAHAFGNLKKRAIVSVLIFLTPYIIILIANIVDPTQTTIQSCAKTIREMGTK